MSDLALADLQPHDSRRDRAGLGSLTTALVERAHRVAVEIDESWRNACGRRNGSSSKFNLFTAYSQRGMPELCRWEMKLAAICRTISTEVLFRIFDGASIHSGINVQKEVPTASPARGGSLRHAVGVVPGAWPSAKK